MWDFLIQKEGESQWQALKEAQSSLYEGRYRLVLHSKLKTTDIEITIICTNEQTTKKYIGKTNAQGLMMIFPYQELSPGLWQVFCSCEDKEARIELNILPIHQQQNDITRQYKSQLEELIKLEIEPYLIKHSAQSLVRAKLLPDLQLILNQSTFFSLQGEVTPIFGRIEMRDTHFPYLILSDFKLRYELQHPTKGDIVVSREQIISIESLPFEFQHFLELPDHLDLNTFFKGQVILETLTPVINTVASQTFTLFTEESEKIVIQPPPPNFFISDEPVIHPALPPRLSDKSLKRKEITLPPLP